MVLTDIPRDPLLDLDPWVGQRACTFTFTLVNAGTHDILGQINPIRGSANLTHDTGRTIKRQLILSLGTHDSANVNPVSDRVLLEMVFQNGATYPLGRYMFTAPIKQKYTSGNLTSATMSDEMFLVDQPILAGLGIGGPIDSLIREVLKGLPIAYEIETSEYNSQESWAIGTTRGQILDALSVTGDFFTPWFDNTGKFRMVRTFNPATRIPSIDLDQGNRVLRGTINEETDLLTAPNVFLVVSNSSGGSTPIVGRATIPSTAPHSVENRGFELIQTQTLALSDAGQAQSVANGLVSRQTIFEKVTLTTPPDPRHDSYNVIRWDGANWLELSWSMQLEEGGTMTHVLRKGYR